MDRNDAVQIVVVKVYTVALRKESVDRNHAKAGKSQAGRVALRKESVDRNSFRACTTTIIICSRSPQGERG